VEEHSPYFDPGADTQARARSHRHKLTALGLLLLCALGFAGWLFTR
jgi:hypothetical protein